MYLVRPERAEDIPLVRALNETAFGRPDEARLVDAVRRREEPTFCLVAVTTPDATGNTGEGPIVGHVLFSPVTMESSGRRCRAVGLGPIAVHPDHRGVGVGSQLIRAGLDRCREEGYEAVVLLGHPTYYSRFGFTMARSRGIHWEHEMPGDPFMVLELVPGALDGVSGVVRYLPEFLSV